MSRKNITELVQNVINCFEEHFGRTPLRQRLEDIFKESIELLNFTDMKNLKEEAGDTLSSLLALYAECGWDPEELVQETLNKIKRRHLQYKSLGRKFKIALLGGAFNPITVGHIKTAQFVLNTSKTFDEVWICPCFSHMYGKKMENPEHRLAMCGLATAVDGRIKVFDYEIKNKLAGETYHFVKKLIGEEFAKDQYDFSLIIGQDNANSFADWVNYEDLVKMIRFVVVPRKGINSDPKVNWYLKPPHIYLSPENDIPEISSTYVRETLQDYYKHQKKGSVVVPTVFLKLKEYLGPEVLSYIINNNLYH